MINGTDSGNRVVRSVHGLRQVQEDPAFELELAAYLRESNSPAELLVLYERFSSGSSDFDLRMRRAIFRAVAISAGHGLQVGADVGFKHLETFEIGDGVFIGAQSYIQGRYDGTCQIGDHVWIGPQSYFDARNLVLEEYVGWGPGAKVLGSSHTGLPLDTPIIRTDLEIKPVHIEAWADIGTNAVILPGVRVGKGSIIGAGAVVTKDIPPFTIAAGVPAQVLRHREEADIA